jgi:hypothetical protein
MKTTLLPTPVRIGKTIYHKAKYKSPEGNIGTNSSNWRGGVEIHHELVEPERTEWLDRGIEGTLYEFHNEGGGEDAGLVGVVELPDGRFETYPVSTIKRVVPSADEATLDLYQMREELRQQLVATRDSFVERCNGFPVGTGRLGPDCPETQEALSGLKHQLGTNVKPSTASEKAAQELREALGADQPEILKFDQRTQEKLDDMNFEAERPR